MKWKSLAPFVLILIAGGLYTWWAVRHEDLTRRRVLREQVAAIAGAVSPSRLELIANQGGGRASGEYQSLEAQLRRLLHRIEDGAFLYVMALNEAGEVVYLMDVEPEEDPEDPVEPGEVYGEASPELKRALRNPLTFTEGPLEDEWGVWVSAFSPILAPGRDRPLAVVGLDVDAGDWRAGLARVAVFPALLSLLVFGLAVWGRQTTRGQGKPTGALRASGREPGFTFLFGFLVTCAVTSSVGRYENGLYLDKVREVGTFKALEMTRLFHELDHGVLRPLSRMEARVGGEDGGWAEEAAFYLEETPARELWRLRLDAQRVEGYRVVDEAGRARGASSEEEREGLGRALERARETGGMAAVLGGRDGLWVVGPEAHGEDMYLAAKVDLLSFFSARVRERGVTDWGRRVSLSLHQLLTVEEEQGLGAMEEESGDGAPLLMVPWLGFGNTYVVRIHATEEGMPVWWGLGPLAWTSLCAGTLVSFTAMLLVGQFMARQVDLQNRVLQDARRLEISEARLARINDCFLGFGPDPEENMRKLTHLVGEVLEADAALYNRLEGERLRTVAAWQPPKGMLWEDGAEGHICTDIIRRNAMEPRVVAHLQESDYRETDPNVKPYGLQTYIGQSVPYEERGLGSLSVVFTRKMEPTKSELTFLAAVASAVRIEEKRRLSGVEVERKDRLLAAAAVVNTILLVEDDARKAVARGLEEIGRASGQDRVYVFEYVRESGASCGVVNQRFEWTREGVSVQLDNPELQGVPFEASLPRWAERFGRDEPVEGLVKDFPPEERAILEPQGIRSLLVVPIYRREVLWGFIGFDNCSEDFRWSSSERAILKSVASSIGASVLRREAEAQLQARNEDLKEAAERARRLVIESERANAAKGEFLARMSHEIRTPMNGILGMARLLEYEEMPSDQREKLEVIIQSGEMLLHIINDILDFSKIEAGKLTLSQEAFDLPVLLESLHRLLSVRARERGIRYLHEVSPETPRYVVGDPLRIRQILMNLIGNAVKFTEEGEVRIAVSGGKTVEGAPATVFEVSDTGSGIPADRVEALFEEFSQLDGSSVRKHEGTGLGLAIVRRLVDLMEGQLEVESEVGKGSLFRVTLPLPWSDAEGVILDDVREDREGLKNCHVLAVDDNETNLKVLSSVLERWECRVNTVDRAPEALEELLRAQREGDAYDCALIDMMMPEWDGVQLARRIQDHAGLEEIPLMVMLSSADVSSEMDTLFRVGFREVLMKPLHSSKLYDVLVDAFRPKATTDFPPQVLVVDDDRSLPRLIARLLPPDTEIEQATSTQEAEEILLAKPDIDLVLCDHELPGEQGLDFCKRMAEMGMPQIRVLMTGISDQDLLLEAVNCGALFQFLPKPLDPGRVRKTVSEAVEKRRGAARKRGMGPPAASQNGVASAGQDGPGASLPILVAEDNKVNQMVAQQYLHKLGVEGRVVSNGEEALQALKTERFGGVLMDLHMPRMDGLAATRALREWEESQGGARMPVIALTADAIKGDREKCLDAGMDDYLAKPLKVADLKRVLAKFDLLG